MYAYVEEGSVVSTTDTLPDAWENVSGLLYLSDAELKPLGWLPVVEVNAAYDPATQDRTGPVYTVNADDVTATYTVVDRNLAAMKAERQAQVNALRDAKMAAGVTWDGNVYDSDIISRANLTSTVSSVSAGLTLPVGFSWRTSDNANVAMDSADLNALAQVMLDHVNACYGASWSHKDAIEALATPAAIDSYDITTGWPV